MKTTADSSSKKPLDRWRDRARSFIAWVKETRAVRAVRRYQLANGSILAGGITYTALFSLSAALTIGVTLLMRVFGNNEQLRDQIFESLDQSVPGLINTGDNGGLVRPEDLTVSPTVTLTSAIAVGVLLFTALRVMAAFRKSLHAMFGMVTARKNKPIDKLRELIGFAVIAVGVFVSAVATIAVSAVGRWMSGQLVGGELWSALIPVGSFLVGVLVDAGMFVLLMRVLAGLKMPRKDLFAGAAVAAAGLGLLRVLGTSVVAGSATSNPLFASATVIITILVWINTSARIILIAAAFAADPPHAILTREEEMSAMSV